MVISLLLPFHLPVPKKRGVPGTRDMETVSLRGGHFNNDPGFCMSHSVGINT